MQTMPVTGGDSPPNNTISRFRKRLAEGKITASDLEKVEVACLELLETSSGTPFFKGVIMSFMQAARTARLEALA